MSGAAPVDAPSLASALDAVTALHRAGRLDEARSASRELAGRFPLESEPHFREGLVEAELGRLEAARDAIGRALAMRELPHYHYALGDVLERMGDRAAAIDAWRRAVAGQPGLAPAHVRLGIAHQEMGDLAQATAHFVLAVQARPSDARAWNNLSAVLLAQGSAREAESAAKRALEIDAGHASAALNLGRALAQQRNDADALPALERSVALDPANALAWEQLGMCRARGGALLAAREAFERATAANPGLGAAWAKLAGVHVHLGQRAEAVEAYRRAESLLPREAAQLGSDRLFAMQYDGVADRREVFEAHREWAARYASAPRRRDFANSRDPGRRLRLAYVSPRFHRSSAGFLIVPVIERHDTAAFEVHCYANQDIDDAFSERIRASGARWTDTRGLGDEQLAERMRADGIDIAIDLAGHTPGHRLTMFALGPAPVTGTWLDYFNTTGMEQVDFLVTDAIHSPPEDAQPFTERLVRLPHCRYCWEAAPYAPEVLPPPIARSGGAPVFASFNRMAKVSPATLDAWCELLRRVPAARLVLKNSSVGRADERAWFAKWFAERGVDPARIEWRGESGHEAMFAEYRDVDIVLDTFPYNGGLTTIEALWMGRPVVTVAGDTLISRQSKAILHAAGLGELCAADAGGFVRVAHGLASDPAGLARLSAGLRDRLRASPLLDHAGFTRDLESLLRDEWRRWCGRGE